MSEITPSRKSPDYLAVQAERDARKRIARAQEEVTKAQSEASHRLDQIQEENAVQTERMALQNEGALQRQQHIGYESLRRIRDEQRDSVGRIEREGKKHQADLEQHYRSGAYQAETTGERKLREIENSNSLQIEGELSRGRAEVTHAQAETNLQMERANETGRKQLEDLTGSQQKRFQSMSENYAKAHEQAEGTFERKLQGTVAKQYQIINDLNSKGARDLASIRDATSLNLSAYQARQSDPFYKLVNLDAELWDDGSEYVITARVPIHERENLTVNFKGDKSVVISGTRRNEEKLDLGDGRVRGTSAYQSFFETLHLDYPVDTRRMTRESDGDTVIFRVPKQGPNARNGPYQAKIESRVKAERPDFPGNLPLPDPPARAKPEDPDDPIPPSPAVPGSRPL